MPNTRRMHRVIEILQIALRKAERNVAQRAKHITHIVKEHSLNVVSDAAGIAVRHY